MRRSAPTCADGPSARLEPAPGPSPARPSPSPAHPEPVPRRTPAPPRPVRRPEGAPLSTQPTHTGTGQPTIDLHTHSTASDGVLPPAALVAEAAAAGVGTLALTDHDTTDGWAEAATALAPDMTLIPGLELSCATAAQDPAEPPISLHLLAYLVDPAEPALAAKLADLRESRVGRARRMVELLAADGHPVSWDEVAADAAGAVGRPHIARALVRAGLVTTMDEAFTPDWIGTGGRYWAGKLELDVTDGIRLVRQAGGVPVFAHPYAWHRGRTVGPETIRAMAAAGLAGLEVDHPDHTAAAREQLRSLAAELGLLVTGSSDFHGPSRRSGVGAETTSPEALAAILAAGTGCAPISGAPG